MDEAPKAREKGDEDSRDDTREAGTPDAAEDVDDAERPADAGAEEADIGDSRPAVVAVGGGWGEVAAEEAEDDGMAAVADEEADEAELEGQKEEKKEECATGAEVDDGTEEDTAEEDDWPTALPWLAVVLPAVAAVVADDS